MNHQSKKTFFPAIVCAELDSPIDALVSLCVPYDEAMNVVASSWRSADSACLVATIEGGRAVAALRTEDGSWAACNAFLDQAGATHGEASRQLAKLLRRGRKGRIGELPEVLAGEGSLEFGVS